MSGFSRTGKSADDELQMISGQRATTTPDRSDRTGPARPATDRPDVVAVIEGIAAALGAPAVTLERTDRPVAARFSWIVSPFEGGGG